MKKALALFALGFLTSCGGGAGEALTGGIPEPDFSSSDYYARVTSFSITPDVVSRGQSFVIEGTYEYSSVIDSVSVGIKIEGGTVSRSMYFNCGSFFLPCTNSISVTCSYVTSLESYPGEGLICIGPDEYPEEIPADPGTYTVTLTVYSFAGFEVIEDSAVRTLTLQ